MNGGRNSHIRWVFGEFHVNPLIDPAGLAGVPLRSLGDDLRPDLRVAEAPSLHHAGGHRLPDQRGSRPVRTDYTISGQRLEDHLLRLEALGLVELIKRRDFEGRFDVQATPEGHGWVNNPE